MSAEADATGSKTDTTRSLDTEGRNTETKVDHGRCLCGAITFTVEGEPIYNVVCHCVNCK